MFLLRHFTITCCLCLFTMTLDAQELISKVDPKLLQSDQDQAVVILYQDQVDVSQSKLVRGKNAKGQYVYQKLIQALQNREDEVKGYLSSKGISFKEFYIVHMLSCTLSLDDIRHIAQLDKVQKIVKDDTFVGHQLELDRNTTGSRTTEWGINKIKAPEVWAMGHTGQNVIIGGQDTGYDWDHVALKEKYRGWNGITANHDYNWHDAIHNSSNNPCGNNSTQPCDDGNHGTHTMGTMVGDDGLGNQIGVAPGSKWIGCRNMDRGNGTLSTYVECFEWFLAPYPVGGSPASGDPDKSPHVINNSWACPASEGCNSTNFDIMELALNNLRSSGVVIVASNGNSGSGCSTTLYPPAFFENSFSVGATNISDGLASFSSRGPVTIDGSNRMKPDVSAPGVNVRSSLATPANGYGTSSGTSMAGPHVAGAVALIISANPTLAGEVDMIEQIIKETATPFNNTQTCGNIPTTFIPNNTFGHGIINVKAAVDRALQSHYVPFIKVDQFGYKPNATKVAIISDPIIGYNSADTFTPPTTIYLKDAMTHQSVFSGSPTVWQGGTMDTLSGDKVWWFNFSSFTTPGTYYISTNGQRSEDFIIGEDVYNDVHQTAFNTYYLQRCGHAKESPYTSVGYHDGPCHTQDMICRSVLAPNNTALFKDMSGGWHDAGDYNKYVNFAYTPVMELLHAYHTHPRAWNDGMNIPESGNQIADILDEVKYETDWLLKMQDIDGGVHSLVGTLNYATASPPSADAALRYYGPKTTSATFSAAAMLAATALQMKKQCATVAQSYASTLQSQAINAYNWAVSNPNATYYNQSDILAAGEQETSTYERSMRRLVAAIYLYDLTNDANYKSYVESNYTNAHLMQWSYAYPFETVTQLALLHFSALPGVTQSVANNIRNVYKNNIETDNEKLPSITNHADAYRAYLKEEAITWGSNKTKASLGNLYLDYRFHQLNPTNDSLLFMSMMDYIHYIHGSNPNALCYMTNMQHLGATRSVNTIYHGWFTDGSPLWDDVRISTYGPAPGIIPGGPNPSWSIDVCCPGCGTTNTPCTNLTPPSGQPALKSYHDWNSGWPQNSWEVTENAIYYQSSYLLLLSSMVSRLQSDPNPDNGVDILDEDVAITGSKKGMILTSPNGNKYRMSILPGGSLTTSSIPTSEAMVKVIDGYLYLKGTDKGIIIPDSNNQLWRINVTNQGVLIANSITSLPTKLVQQSQSDLEITSNLYGPILKSTNGDCHKICVSDSGVLFTIPIGCGE